MIFINFHLLKDVLQQCYKYVTPFLVTFILFQDNFTGSVIL